MTLTFSSRQRDFACHEIGLSPRGESPMPVLHASCGAMWVEFSLMANHRAPQASSSASQNYVVKATRNT
ncbi:MAG: hypothetical protein C4334_04360 [Pyrinomonas sp.]